MAKIDDYNQACEIARQELNQKDIKGIAELSGAKIKQDADGKDFLLIRFLNRDIRISWPEIEMTDPEKGDEINIQQQVFLLHYMNGAADSGGAPLTGEWIAYQEIPDGKFYLGPFTSRARTPLLKAFGERPKLMVELAKEAYDATPLDHGDYSVEVQALPFIKLALVLFEGDEEFPPESNILFDKNISKIISAEDTAWLAGSSVYPLMGMARGR